MQIPPSMATDVIIAPIDDAEYDLIKANKELLIALIKIDQIKFVAQEPTEGLFSTGICQDLKIIIPLPPELCLQEKNRLEKELQKIADKMNKLNLNLQNEAFMQNAPKAVTEKLQTQLEQAINEEKEIKSRLLKL